METLSQAIERLRGDGYDLDLWIADDGTLTDGTTAWGADRVAVDHVVRFEGHSNPDDEAILLAATITDGPKGLLTLPYGPDLSGPQAETVKDLTLRPQAGPAV